MKSLLQAHPSELTVVIKSNSFRREELAKIKFQKSEEISKAHLQLE
jgi:hypothetical protein